MQVARLALLSLVAVFKDVLPGYRIRLPTEKELAMQVSKEVRKLRDFESALLKHFQAYLKGALAVAQGKRGMSLAVTAVKCLCSLLATKFSFNYASDLLQVCPCDWPGSKAPFWPACAEFAAYPAIKAL